MSQRLKAQLNTRNRFSIEVPIRDAANSIYAAMKAEVESRGGKIIMDENTKTCIFKAAEWLTDSGEKSGLMLMGLFGNGKTTMLKGLIRLISYLSEQELGYNDRIRYSILTAKDICQMSAQTSQSEKIKNIYNIELLGIDELGGDPKEMLVYGMPLTPIADLLAHRYNKQLLTIVTTNLNNSELRSHYGERIYDRFKEMMKVIVFENPSFRR